MKFWLIIIAVIATATAFTVHKNKRVRNRTTNRSKSIYDYAAEDIDGNIFDFSSLKGKKIMIVNTASKCGLTSQYEGLQDLYEKYGERHNFIIIAFPSNNFLFQEPGTNKQIAEFCKLNYGVTFPIMGKVDVKGRDKHKVYEFLTTKELNGYRDSKIKWNFQKYLIGRDGKLEKIVNPRLKPDDHRIINWIENKV